MGQIRRKFTSNYSMSNVTLRLTTCATCNQT